MALCLAVSVLPTIAFATQSKEMTSTASYVYVNGVKLTSGSYWKNGDTSRPTGNSSNYNAYFTNGTLYLNNANITQSYIATSDRSSWYRGSIYTNGDLNINISGNNNLTDSSDRCIGIWVMNGSLAIYGSGSISVCKKVMDGMGGGNSGIDVEKNLSISDCSVVADAGGNGITSNQNLTIRNSSVTANGDTGTGIFATSMDVIDSTIIASGNYSGIDCFDIGTLTVSGKSRVDCSGWDAINSMVNASGFTIIAGDNKSSAKAISNFNNANIENYYGYVSIYSPSSSTPTPTPSGRFTDVPTNAWYYEAVEWAVDKGIVTGMTDTTFAPNRVCTRAEVMQILWATKGKKYISSSRNPFTDVDSNAWYANAVLWAYQNGITSGTTRTTFSPAATCTRAQVMTFIWAAQNNPSASGSISFRDVSSSAYYYNAVKWAVKNGVTSGTSATTFSPNQQCTRAQIVTFIYKAMA